ncbi:MAG: acyl-CoA thioesterase [Anaerolineaceae bacterium]|nr:acyl-CoA thioesterase [Anaerolineaceae bacterium]
MTTIMPSYPQDFPYYQEIEVRYADLDTLQHVNNVTIMQYVENARIGYYQATGIWDGKIRQGFGMVVASVKIDFVTSIMFGDPVRVGVKTGRIGGKSITFLFQVENSQNGQVFARGEVVMVSFSQEKQKSVPVSQEWREKLASFDNNQELLAKR